MNRIVVNAGLGNSRISRHIYGHFAEHLGRCIYDGLWVGEKSSIPNVRGIRSDVVEALKKIGIPNLRWPGGCFADEYHWMDGIGPKAARPKMVNTHWGGVTEDNSFGTHEFLDLCSQLDCEPYICGNVGSGTVQELSQWVEYVNFDGVSPMAELRRKNGRDRAWGVKFWGIGNENWGCGGLMRPEYYADLYRRYGIYCRQYGYNKLFKIACGPRNDDYHWTDVLMSQTFMEGNPRNQLHGLALHYYTVPGEVPHRGSATVFNEDEWFLTMKKALFMEELVSKHSAIMDKYDPRKKVALIVDEWGTWYDVEPGTNPGFLYQQNTMRDAVVAGIHLNIFNNHSDRVRMANIAQTVNVLQSVILTEGEKMVLTPTYHVFEMFKVHQGASLVPTIIESEDYATSRDSVPAVSASASRDDEGRIHLSLCNLDHAAEKSVTCEIAGAEVRTVEGRILKSESMRDANTFDAPARIVPTMFRDFSLGKNSLTVKMPPRSVAVLELR